MVSALATAAACVLIALGEILHARRCRRVATLVFGPSRRAAAWVRAVPALRTVAIGLATWGLVTLLQIEPKVHVEDTVADAEYRHLLLVLDVSPSMRLKDAGPTRQQTRSQRARDVVDSLFQRVSIGRYKISIVATYNGARPVVIDTEDSEVVRNILGDLPMHYAFPVGKTKLFDGLTEAAKVAKPWPARSTILVVISDGDTVPATGMPAMPPSIASVLVVGVGDPLAGTFIDGKQSRQDVSVLRQLAARLNGHFHNANDKHLPSETIRAIAAGATTTALEKLTRREYALLAIALGTSLLALLPLLLHLQGTRWQPGVPRATATRGAA